MQVEFKGTLWDELQKIIKLHAHARSCRKIGNLDEAKNYEKKADELAVQWFRKLRPKV